MRGYASPEYAMSLAEFGTPRELTRCGGWILEREIQGFSNQDAIGCYPLFSCTDWAKLPLDLDDLCLDLVSLACVPDPFGDYDEDLLHTCFPDRVFPFKEHFIIDLALPIQKVVSKHHRYYARKALEVISVDTHTRPIELLEDWVSLYQILTERHNIRGIQAFSYNAFEIQLSIPDLVMFHATHQGKTVGAHLWFLIDNVATSHLAAFNDLGYTLMASYALYWYAIEYFSDKASWINLGAGAGIEMNSQDGLTRFKRGWASGTKTAYFCGRILDGNKYDEMVRSINIPLSNYFPAYRKGEFG